MEYFFDALKKYADFTGRARRKEYWMFLLIYVVIFIALSVIDSVLGTAVLSTIYSLAMIIPCISIGARRLHDTGRSGWWQLIQLIPLLGTIVLLIFLCLDSTDENNWGVSPKFLAAA
jgi:uncharacterized membrane protein YhaH (DUF805 family)